MQLLPASCSSLPSSTMSTSRIDETPRYAAITLRPTGGSGATPAASMMRSARASTISAAIAASPEVLPVLDACEGQTPSPAASQFAAGLVLDIEHLARRPAELLGRVGKRRPLL